MLAETFQTLPATLSAAWHHPFTSGNYTVTVFAVSAGMIGFACCYWAAWMHARLANYRLATERERTHAEADIRFRDALLSSGQEAIAVLGSDMKEPFFAGAGRELLQAAMAGKDAVLLAGALDALLKSAAPFEFPVRKPGAGTIAMRGAVVSHRAVVFLRDLGTDDLAIDYRATLDSLTMPVWIRGRDLALRWGNRAFLAAVGRSSISGTAIERSEPDLAAIARDGASVADARRFAAVEGERRALSLNLTRLADGSVAGSATDITETVQAEARLVLAGEAHADVLEHVPAAIAIFGLDQRLIGYNHAYAEIWNLPEDWLNTHPSKGDVLDRLRATQSLPEQRDFAAWKRSQLQLFENTIAGPIEDVRHLPDGRSIRVTARPYMLGGVVYQHEDLTEQLRIESSFKMLGQVLRATLDTVDDGIAIFWPDGRMVLHNRAFAALWQLTERELAGEPHLAQVAALSQARVGQDGIWGIVSAGVTSDEPERCAQWGKTARADGKIVSLSMSRLPNGGTVVTFSDLTNLRRFEITSEAPAHVAA